MQTQFFLKKVALLGSILLFSETILADFKIFPNFPCSKWYDRKRQQIFPKAVKACFQNSTCDRKIMAMWNVTDIKGCRLWKLRAIGPSNNLVLEWDPTQKLQRVLFNIMGNLIAKEYTPAQNKERIKYVEMMLNRSIRCKRILNDLVNKQRLPSSKWNPFYDCIENAWDCPDTVGNYQSSSLDREYEGHFIN